MPRLPEILLPAPCGSSPWHASPWIGKAATGRHWGTKSLTCAKRLPLQRACVTHLRIELSMSESCAWAAAPYRPAAKAEPLTSLHRATLLRPSLANRCSL